VIVVVVKVSESSVASLRGGLTLIRGCQVIVVVVKVSESSVASLRGLTLIRGC